MDELEVNDEAATGTLEALGSRRQVTCEAPCSEVCTYSMLDRSGRQRVRFQHAQRVLILRSIQCCL